MFYLVSFMGIYHANSFDRILLYSMKIGVTMSKPIYGLGDRLRVLRAERNISGERVAKAISAQRASYGAWERGERPPPPHMLLRLADYYSVSVDFLLGRSITRSIAADGLTDNQIIAIENMIRSFTNEKNWTN